jgi:prophage regulatory protein
MEITTVTLAQQLPQTGYLRLPQIIGRDETPKATSKTKRAKPAIPALVPISKSSWWAGIKTGRYPKPVKLGPHTTAWRVEDIMSLLTKLALEGARQ